MTATTRSDPSLSVEYSFSETSGNSGGTSSGWQVSATYTDDGLTLDTTYSYTVTMRDSSGNIGPPSEVAMALTTGAPDTTAPTLISFGDDVGGGPITVGDPVTYPVTYTVTFSEAMNASTVDTADFENNPSLNGPATITVDSVGTTGNPAVFEVAVTTTGVGLLQLQIVSTATLEDPAANALVPASASPDNDIIAFANLVGELGILNLTANGGINPNTGNPWQVGDQYRLAFHTVGSTGTRNATSNDPADYNTYVTAEAHANATLVGTTWKAMVSVNLNSSTTEALSAKVNVKDNTDTADLSGGSGIGGAGFPVYAIDGTTCIARNNADIWNGWSNPFDSDSNVRTGSVRYSPFLDQFGNQTVNPNANDGIDVATGAKSNGSDSNPLGNTTDNTTFTRGAANANTSGRVWEIFTNNTSDTLSYYALSEPLTVQATSPNTPPTVTINTPDQTVYLQTVTTIPGLYYGTASGDINESTPNPETEILVDVSSRTENSIAGSTTEIYTGNIFDADGQISFTEYIDDKARIWIDGNLVLSNDAWNTRTQTANLNLAPGWHTIEIRISNGGGGSGPVGGEIGIGYDPAGGTAWQILTDPGDGSFLRINQNAVSAVANQAVANLDGTVTDAEQIPTTTWTRVGGAGAGDVTFGDASAVDTTATFTEAGTYVLRLTADDGYDQSFDEITITVMPPAPLANYDAWATGGELSGDDANGDGVSNGLAFLLGAATPTVDAQGLLPVPTADGSGNLVMTFNCLPTTDRGTAALKVSYSKDLVSWTDTVTEVPDADGNDAGGDVSYVVVAGPAGTPTTKTVTATIDSSVADGGDKLFGRLVGEE
ncbi:hypothetical protein [Rubritalea profundi]|uniref:PA14 domain-containing protein n=1 Tax=Rubritalea profundi TaxID=1658618 RepID=A0A2S7TZG1_9BACT|nr:hypothetical protein [Rubritalea profundi]PQJ27621.1 hypothetical protein BSZ32_03325 [Rubritalea profundi]